MDPNANLHEQAELIRELAAHDAAGMQHSHAAYITATTDLAVLRYALSDWLRNGGFAPDWAQHPASVQMAWVAWVNWWSARLTPSLQHTPAQTQNPGRGA